MRGQGAIMEEKRSRQETFRRMGDDKSDGNMLKAAVIEAMIQREVTFAKFSELHREYMVSISTPAGKISSNRNNLLKDLFSKDKDLTYKRFILIMRNILGLNLTNWMMTFRSADNSLLHLNLDRITY